MWSKLLCILLVSGSLLSEVKGAVIEVCDTCSHHTVSDAMRDVAANDTLLIRAGIYTEYGIKVDKPLVIRGEAGAVINGDYRGEIMTVVSDSVTIEGLEFKNVGTSYTEDYAAIRVQKSEHFVIKNNILKTLFFGIYLEKSSHGIVAHNRIIGNAKSEHNSGNGIHLWYSKSVQIYGNHVTHMRDGIYFEFVDHSHIYDNISTDNLRYGLHFMFSNDDVYSNNTFERNGAGVAVMFSKRISMQRNRFQYNWGTASYGLLLKEISGADISENVFDNNTIGINIEGATNIDYTRNTFKNNGWALRVRGACYTNKFRNNNFLNNSFDISYNSKLNDNEFDHNYWSTYTGYDLDHDGIGDVPYRPVKLFSYIVNRTPEAIILLRSLFIDIIDFSEKVSPVFTPDNLFDSTPLMKPIYD